MKLAKYTTFILIFSLLFVAIPTFAQSGLPALCTGVQLQNTSNQTAYSIVMHFFMPGNDGIADYSYTVQNGLGAYASRSFYLPDLHPDLQGALPDSRYSVVVTSDRKLNSLVNETTCTVSPSVPYVSASHSGPGLSETGTTVYLGYVLSRAFAQNWSSAIAIQNMDVADASVTIQFLSTGGSSIQTFTKNPLKVGETWYLDLSTGQYATLALNNFSGSAKITSNRKMAAVANYAPNASGYGSRLMSYNGVAATSQTLYATQVNKYAFAGNYTSGLTLYNPNGSATPISVDFFPSGSTTPVCTLHDTIPANASWIKYLGSITTCNIYGSLPPNGFNGYAKVQVTSGGNQILGIFNMDSSVGQAGAANMVRSEDRAPTLYFPQIVRNAFGGFQSGWQVVNTTANNLNLTITYTRDTGATFVDHKTVNANSALTVYVGAAEYQSTLGDNWNGGVKVSVDGSAGQIVGQANITAPYGGDALAMYNAFRP
jgi:hypothetical protein